jgi:hypothetical protein
MVHVEVDMIIDNDILSLYPSTVTKSKTTLFKKIDEAVVDGELWHTVYTLNNTDVSKWVRQQPGVVETSTSWAFNAFFDVPDKVYMMLILRWQ